MGAALPAWIPRTQQGWAVLWCRFMSLFAAQGVVLLVLYAIKGPSAGPDGLPPGLQLDRLHAVIHLVSGLIGGAIGFWRPAWAIRFTQLFSVFYLLLAVFGTFTSLHFGMQLEFSENALHWGLEIPAALIGFAPLLTRRSAPAS